MIKIYLRNIFYLFILVNVVACKDHDEYRVDSSFTEYLARFETIAAGYGKKFDLKDNGIIIEFANLKDNVAGLTHYENPIRIEIDKTYWNKISEYSGADLMKEDLMFHELGHGLLGRKHLNSTLDNDDWKSMMCGGDKVDGRSWNINYRGIRRAYYLDELFNESTSAPDFSKNVLTVDTTAFTRTYTINNWSVVDDSQRKTSIIDGRLKFESKLSTSYIVYAKLSSTIDFDSDFVFQLSIEYPDGDNANQYGSVFGNPSVTSNSNDSVEYFVVDNNKKMFMGNRSWYSFYTELSKPAIISKGRNQLKIVKIGTIMYYFINNSYSYCSEIETKGTGNYFGFIVPPMGVVWIDDFKISLKYSSSTAFKIKQNEAVNFEMRTTDLFNNRAVKNR